MSNKLRNFAEALEVAMTIHGSDYFGLQVFKRKSGTNEATFFFRVNGDSMTSSMPERSIPNNATLIVDRSREAKHDDIVVAILDDEFTVKRLYRRGKRLALVAENSAYPPIVLNEDQELNIWGVVTAWIVEPL